MSFQVFLSHSSAEKAAVEEIARRLLREGIEAWLDKWHLIPGDPWQPAIEKALAESESCVDLLVHDVRNQPGALPLLQHALLELWNNREGRRLTVKGYQEIGKLEGALQKRKSPNRHHNAGRSLYNSFLSRSSTLRGISEPAYTDYTEVGIDRNVAQVRA